MSVKDLVQKAVNEINEHNQGRAEDRVKNLVHKILQTEHEISKAQEYLASYKKELKELELPKPVAMDI